MHLVHFPIAWQQVNHGQNCCVMERTDGLSDGLRALLRCAKANSLVTWPKKGLRYHTVDSLAHLVCRSLQNSIGIAAQSRGHCDLAVFCLA